MDAVSRSSAPIGTRVAGFPWGRFADNSNLLNRRSNAGSVVAALRSIFVLFALIRETQKTDVQRRLHLMLVAAMLSISTTATAQQAPGVATSAFHTRQHPRVLAPHRTLPPRVPEAKRHPLPPAKAGSVIGGIWMTDANFKSTLYLRSIIATTAITREADHLSQ